MKIGQRIRNYRLSASLTQKELGKLIGATSVSIGNWENDIKTPGVDMVVSLARVFNISIDKLLGVTTSASNDDFMLFSKSEKELISTYRILDYYGKKAVESICEIEKRRQESASKHKTTPYITKNKGMRYIPKYLMPSAAGTSIPMDIDDFEMIQADDSVPYNADFAVIIQGNSMYPYINDGDTVYVQRTTELSIGDIGIFCVDGVMYCKQYYVDENKNLFLLSANEELKHTNIFVDVNSDSDVRCFGKVLLGQRLTLPTYI